MMAFRLARAPSLFRRLGVHVETSGTVIDGLSRVLTCYEDKIQSFSSSAGFNEEEHRSASFGYRTVPEEEKSKLVREVFDNVANRYDLMNDIMSGGLHRLWKDRLVSELRPFPGVQHIDVAGGTGDVAFRVLDSIITAQQRVGRAARTVDAEDDDPTQVIVCDINPAMLDVGRTRAKDRGWGDHPALVFMEGDAEALELEDESMDSYSIAFGIRNVTRIDRALREAYRVLKPGGRFICLELSHVQSPVLRQVYDFYSFGIIPQIGELVTKDRDSYQYLVESIRKFPNQMRFANMISEAGFQKVAYENLVGGVVAIHSGFKL